MKAMPEWSAGSNRFSTPEIPALEPRTLITVVSGSGGKGVPEGIALMSTASKNTGFPKSDIVIHYIDIAAVILTKLGSVNCRFTVVSAPADVVTLIFFPPFVAPASVNVAPKPIT